MGRILLADPSADCQKGLLEAIAPEDRLECCGDGQRTLELLRVFAPDVLILDMRLSDVDGTWVLRRGAEAGLLPMTIVTGHYFSADLLRLLERYGADAVIHKAYQPCCLLELLRDLLETSDSQEVRQISTQDRITNALVSLGVVTSQSGFRYLRDGIRMKEAEPAIQLTKNLYPTIAKQHNVSPDAVEKAMRTSIRTAYHRGSPEQWRRYFAADSTGQIPLPTNGQFLSRLAQCCKTKGKRREDDNEHYNF